MRSAALAEWHTLPRTRPIFAQLALKNFVKIAAAVWCAALAEILKLDRGTFYLYLYLRVDYVQR